MKKIIIAISCVCCISAIAQTSPPPSFSRNSITTNPPKINSRKGTLIEKKTNVLAKFKSLNIQKIITKDLTDNSSETVLGVMYEYETYDGIFKKTLTIEKQELSKLILSLQMLEQKENDKNNQEAKYKFVTMSNIEIGGIYHKEQNLWINYIKFPSGNYNSSLNEFSKEELKELIRILKNAEQEL
ncbi:hypothetical protein [Chryseobacterium sp.]|uniref:hypothetical protein n=1 Tax=Chryseobacterium sp. TaxID=1871047 RepID=UPI003219AB72